MNFFEDDFGFSESPLKANKKSTQIKKPSNQQMVDDGLDDLLDDLLKKQQNKKSRQKSRQNYASPIKQSPPPKPSLDRTDRFQPYQNFRSSQDIDLHQTHGISNPRGSVKSINLPEDDSFKNIFTGPSRNDEMNFEKKNEAPQFSVAGSIRGMKPPLRKRGDSREGSVRDRSVNDQSVGSYQDFKDQEQLPLAGFNNRPNGSVNFSLEKPPIQKRSSQTNLYSSQMPPLPNSKPTISPSPPRPQEVQDKIVYVKQSNEAEKKKHEEQLQRLRKEKDNEIQRLNKRLQEDGEQRKRMVGQFSKQRQKDRQFSQSLMKREIQNLKEMQNWELKKKAQIYESQISQLKKINEILQEQLRNFSKQQNNTSAYSEEIRMKVKELEYEKKKLEVMQRNLTDKERALQSRQFDFDNYRMKEQQELQKQQKRLYDYQMQLERRKTEFRKGMEEQKINLSHDLAKQHLQYQRRKQELKRQKEQLEIDQQLFHKQKQNYETFNSNVLKQYHHKYKQLSQEKHNLQQLQTQMYQRLHTVELMAEQKLNPQDKNTNDRGSHMPQKKNISLDNIEETKNRYKQLQQTLENGKVRLPSSSIKLPDSQMNLKSYLLKMNRNNIRNRPF